MDEHYNFPKTIPHYAGTTVKVLTNPLEQQVIIYETIRDKLSLVNNYVQTKLDLWALVTMATTQIMGYIHETPITQFFNLVCYSGKSPREVNRKQRKLKERAVKRQEKEKRMKNPTGNSKYANKAEDGNEAFWKKKRGWAPDSEQNYPKKSYTPNFRLW